MKYNIYGEGGKEERKHFKNYLIFPNLAASMFLNVFSGNMTRI